MSTEGTVKARSVFESRPMGDIQTQRLEDLKTQAAILWDNIDRVETATESPEAIRLVRVAKTTLEETVMWAVKAISRQ